MRKITIFSCCTAALLLCVLQLTAQVAGRSGAQAFEGPRKWHGLDLKMFFDNGNTVTGLYSLTSCTTCTTNTADGEYALNACTTCGANIAVGYMSAFSCTSCKWNVAIGGLTENTTGTNNVAIGLAAMNYGNGSSNVAIGEQALENATTSQGVAVGLGALASGENYSTAVGYEAMFTARSTTGYNTALGAYAMGVNSNNGNTGSYNVALGASTLYNNTSGFLNSASGYVSLYYNTTGLLNVGDGYGTLYSNTTGSYNTAVGGETMEGNTTGTYNTALGFAATVGSGALTNSTAVGANSTVNSSNQVVIGNSAVTSIGGYAGWSNFSDGRYKKNIQENVPGLVFINKLNPVTYTLDIAGIETRLRRNRPVVEHQAAGADPKGGDDPVMTQAMQEKAAVTYTGFVAQDVEKAAESVNYVFSGVDKPKNSEQSFYGLRYSDFVPPLVKAVQELSTQNESLQSKYDSLQTQVNELRAMLLAQKSTVSGASLEQNAPNPFTGSTVIGYNLPAGVSSAQLQITDASGKVLALIPLSGSGRNSVTANVAGYAAGTYQYSLIVDGKLVGTRQMVSVR